MIVTSGWLLHPVLDMTTHAGCWRSLCRRSSRITPKLSIAVLRLDGNFYSSHEDSLYAFWDFVPAGGIFIFDDGYHPESTCVRTGHSFSRTALPRT